MLLFWYKFHLQDAVLARVIYALIFALSALATGSYFSKDKRYASTALFFCAALLFVLVQRFQNTFAVFLAVSLGLLFIEISSSDEQPLTWRHYIMSLWMSQSCFFAFGNTNSVATIDISGAYTGLIDYNEIMVGTLVALIGFTGPLLCFLALIDSLNNHRIRYGNFRWKILEIIFFNLSFQAASSTMVIFIVTLLRHHLFIWTVFSPKFIYQLFFIAFELFKCCSLLVIAAFWQVSQ